MVNFPSTCLADMEVAKSNCVPSGIENANPEEDFSFITLAVDCNRLNCSSTSWPNTTSAIKNEKSERMVMEKCDPSSRVNAVESNLNFPKAKPDL